MDICVTSSIRFLVPAIAKFFHANDLGPLVIFPKSAAIRQVLGKLRSKRSKSWIRDPGDLVYIEPAGGINNRKMYGSAAALVSGGGPFLLQNTNLVTKVLGIMGYIDDCASLPQDGHLAAVDLFCSRNKRELEMHVVQMDMLFPPMSAPTSDILSMLSRVFASPLPQRWNVPPSDSCVRQELHGRGYLKNGKATRAVVIQSIQQFLKEKGFILTDTSYYWTCVAEFMKHTSLKKDPKAPK